MFFLKRGKHFKIQKVNNVGRGKQCKIQEKYHRITKQAIIVEKRKPTCKHNKQQKG